CDLNLGKVALYQLSYSRVEPCILPPVRALSTALRSPSRRTGQAARRYAHPDHRVSSAAPPSSQSPTWNSGTPIQMSVPGCSGYRGLIEYSRHDSATIWAVVLILPMVATLTVARWPSSAIHSRSAETAISRPTITAAQNAIQGVGWPCTIRNRATATISLSATGSRKAPNAEYWWKRRAIQPSSQSVTAAGMNTNADAKLVHCEGMWTTATSTGISTIRSRVSQVGMVSFMSGVGGLGREHRPRAGH